LTVDSGDEMVVGDECQHLRYENEERVLFPDACAGQALFWMVVVKAENAFVAATRSVKEDRKRKGTLHIGLEGKKE